MGLFFTLVYLVSLHMGLPELLPFLAPIRPQLTVAVLTTLATLPMIFTLRRPFTGPQVWLLSAFVTLVILSWLPRGYFGGVLATAQDFLPDVAGFFFVALNVTTLRRLRIAVATLICAAIITVLGGIQQYRTVEAEEDAEEPPYVMIQRIGSETGGEALVLKRLRGLGVLNDPNDFAQYLLILLPFVLLLWDWDGHRRRSLFFILPTGLLFLTGIYLSKSRGALLGLVTLGWFLIRGNPKLVALGVVGGVVFLARYASSFTGGRDISVQGGADRLDLWSDGLQMIKSSPLWGVGYHAYGDETGGLTAHNSFLLCAAETGLPAYFLWIGLLVVSIIQLRAIAYETGPNAPGGETQRWSQGLLAALYMFVVTSFFLSRTFAPTLYALLGMSAAIAAMEARRRDASPFPRYTWWQFWAFGVGSALLVLIYSGVRLGNALRTRL